MKKLFILLAAIFAFTNLAIAGDGDKIPTTTVKKLDGTKINTNTNISHKQHLWVYRPTPPWRPKSEV